MRLFIAVELNKSMQAEAARVQNLLREKAEGGRFTPKENFHITMHFIGESNDLSSAAFAMRESVRGFKPFPLALGGYGSFAHAGKRTSFVHVCDKTGELETLHESLEAALYDAGFSREDKRFTPHITLARSVVHDEQAERQLKELVTNASMEVRGITLFESVRTERGIQYFALHRERF